MEITAGAAWVVSMTEIKFFSW